jgi:hypothetical protein
MARTGADPGFQVRGAHLNFFGVFRVKNHDFTPKNHIFYINKTPPAPQKLIASVLFYVVSIIDHFL